MELLKVEGAVWKIKSVLALQASFSFRLTSADSCDTVVANSVIPTGWKPSKRSDHLSILNPKYHVVCFLIMPSYEEILCLPLNYAKL